MGKDEEGAGALEPAWPGVDRPRTYRMEKPLFLVKCRYSPHSSWVDPYATTTPTRVTALTLDETPFRHPPGNGSPAQLQQQLSTFSRRCCARDCTRCLCPSLLRCCAYTTNIRYRRDRAPVHNASGVAPSPPRRGQGVQLIEEQHAWSGESGLREHLPDVALRLSHVHIQELCSIGSCARKRVGSTVSVPKGRWTRNIVVQGGGVSRIDIL